METFIDSPEAMHQLGYDMGKKALSGEVYALVGEMGAGKTSWTKGFTAAIASSTQVTSPTFSLVNEYHGESLSIYHLDVHRLESVEELIALGWDELLQTDGIVICEWADKFPEIMPTHTRWILLKHTQNGGRTFEINGQ